mgnify:CR=1 FL=1
MNGNVFLDSNIAIYAHTNLDLAKQAIAQRLVNRPDCLISTQVCSEFANALRKKFKLDWPAIQLLLDNLLMNAPVHVNTPETIRQATGIAHRYGFSFYDSLIIAAALETGCTTLYSEDLQHGQVIDGKLEIQNPFLPQSLDSGE